LHKQYAIQELFQKYRAVTTNHGRGTDFFVWGNFKTSGSRTNEGAEKIELLKVSAF